MFVCGDIHGCLDQLETKLRMIGFDKTKDQLFALGDLVDRGENSPAVVEIVAGLMDKGRAQLVCILGGIGTAGVPSGSLPVVALICAMVGVNPIGIGLILGVNHFLDMCRTTLNVTGDLTLASLVAKGERGDVKLPGPPG